MEYRNASEVVYCMRFGPLYQGNPSKSRLQHLYPSRGKQIGAGKACVREPTCPVFVSMASESWLNVGVAGYEVED